MANGTNGIGAAILANYEAAEEQGSDAGDFGIDFFSNSFEDEFPGDNADVGGTFIGYSPEADRSIQNRAWGNFSDRPKIWELNQPNAAQVSGLRIIDLIPRRNRKWVWHRLGGTPAELRTMVQIIQATRQATGANIDFDQWLELFRNGFLDFQQNRNLGNFQITGENQWERLKDPETRPRWGEWTTSFQRADLGFRVGEYWPDYSLKNFSFLITGTDLMLISQVMQIEHQQQVKRESRSKDGAWPPMQGQPQIRLFFKGEGKAEAETSFRIMDRTDNPKISLQIIDKSDLRKYAERIKKEFATPDLFVWQKGREAFSYKNRWQGFDGQWWLCRNEAAGRALLNKLLAIAELPLDEAKTRISKATNESLAFPANPPNEFVLGEEVPQDKKRPLVDVVFHRAEIKLAKMRSPIPLVERGLVVYS